MSAQWVCISGSSRGADARYITASHDHGMALAGALKLKVCALCGQAVLMLLQLLHRAKPTRCHHAC